MLRCIKILLYLTMVAIAILSLAYVSDIDIIMELHNLYCYIKRWVSFYKIWNGLKLLLKFLIILCDIALQYFCFIFYYISLLLLTVIDFVSLFNPTLYHCISSILELVSWSAINIVQGIFFRSDQLTVFLSWIVVFCLSVLYLDLKFQSLMPTNNTDIPAGFAQGPLQSTVFIKDTTYGRGTKALKNYPPIRLRTNVPTNIEQVNGESSNSPVNDLDENHLFRDARENLSETTDYQPVVMENSLDCTICMLDIRNVAVFPCGHTHFCKSCVEKIMLSSKTCPICANDIHNYRNIFL